MIPAFLWKNKKSQKIRFPSLEWGKGCWLSALSKQNLNIHAKKRQFLQTNFFVERKAGKYCVKLNSWLVINQRKQRMKQHSVTRKRNYRNETFFTTSCTFPLKRKNEVAYQIKMLLIIKKTIDVIKMNTTKGINGLSLWINFL